MGCVPFHCAIPVVNGGLYYLKHAGKMHSHLFHGTIATVGAGISLAVQKGRTTYHILPPVTGREKEGLTHDATKRLFQLHPLPDPG
jgi:hypothetical protein